MGTMGAWTRGPVIGRGSSATVSLASAHAHHLFAVKSADLSRSSLLQREHRILSSLSSPHVVSCLGFDDVVDGSYNLFLEYAPGGSLADEIKRSGGRLAEPAVRLLAGDVLAGLACLHGNGVTHCDIKPRNVLIGPDGRAVVADLGCGRLAGEDEGRFQIRGTPAFMAPEVARGDEQGAPADVWALGCTVVEMATGRPPWHEASDAVALLHRIGFSEELPEIPCWLSDEGKDFVARCLRRDPKERWTTEELLSHPFLNDCASVSSSDDRTWTSPKSILDQRFWESLTTEEEVVVAVDEAAGRIQALAGGGNGGAPSWTWDENWVAVRIDGGEEEAEISSAETVGGETGLIDITTAGTSGEEDELMFSATEMYTENSPSGPHYYQFVDEFNCNSRNVVEEEHGRGVGFCSSCNFNCLAKRRKRETLFFAPKSEFLRWPILYSHQFTIAYYCAGRRVIEEGN